MLAYIRVVVVWAVSPMALPSSKDCAYNLPRKALRVKLVLPSFQISGRETGDHQTPRMPAAMVRWYSTHRRHLFRPFPTRANTLHAKLCTQRFALSASAMHTRAHRVLRAKLCATQQAAPLAPEGSDARCQTPPAPQTRSP